MGPLAKSLWKLKRAWGDVAGNAFIEAAFVIPALFSLSVGSLEVGLHLDRYLELQRIARSTASMYSRGINLKKPGVKALILGATDGAASLVDETSAGTGVLYLSRIAVASAGGNQGLPVVRERLTMGNALVGPSKLATPVTDADGHVVDYENQGAARATLPAGVILTGAQELFVAELIHQPVDLKLLGLMKRPYLYRAAYY